jgi:hypothetical protein
MRKTIASGRSFCDTAEIRHRVLSSKIIPLYFGDFFFSEYAQGKDLSRCLAHDSTVDTVYSTVDTVYNTVDTVHSAVDTVYSVVDTVYSVADTVHSAVDTVNSAVDAVYSAVDAAYSTTPDLTFKHPNFIRRLLVA